MRDGEILLSCRERAGAWVEREGESVNKIGIIAKPRPDAKPLLEDLVKWLEARGLEPVLDIDTAAVLGRSGISASSRRVSSPRGSGSRRQ